jgi:anti-sigma28 factor (negative regulator of flagellin synthesis)
VDGRATQNAGASKGPLRDDRADLSGIAERVLEAGSEVTPERAEKLERLRQEVLSGRYQVDSTLTARGMIRDALGDKDQ